ncbi:MAG: hypothetical protein CMJ18_18250 [Phycisphaeraceae bacterium]|nr:hypothetical protein [Phycisphaeraceae bacterium]
MTETNATLPAPTPRDIRTFGLLWLIFFAGLGGIVWWKAGALVGAGIFLGAALLVSLVLNGAHRLRQLQGVFLPGLFLVVGLVATRGAVKEVITTLIVVGAAGTVVIAGVPAVGRVVYRFWLEAAEPIGWTISHFILALTYYLVLTPIGLIARLVGYNPMKKQLDPSAETYWIKHEARDDRSSYFRQF